MMSLEDAVAISKSKTLLSLNGTEADALKRLISLAETLTESALKEHYEAFRILDSFENLIPVLDTLGENRQKVNNLFALVQEILNNAYGPNVKRLY
jgi:hypothetical protein